MLPHEVKQEPMTNGDTVDVTNGHTAVTNGTIDLTLNDSDEVKMEE